MRRAVTPMRLVAGAFFLAVTAAGARAAALSPVIDPVRWQDDSAAIAGALGPRAIHLSPPIVFGDSYVDVAIRAQMLGGYRFVVYYQMDNTTRRLKRIMLERQRHGANAKAFSAVITALTDDYGPPAQGTGAATSPGNGYQAARGRVWYTDHIAIRAVFRDTTVEAGEGCISGASAECGLTGHLYVQITPAPGS